jgi:hypothetical protein
MSLSKHNNIITCDNACQNPLSVNKQEKREKEKEKTEREREREREREQLEWSVPIRCYYLWTPFPAAAARLHASFTRLVSKECC